MLSLFSPAALRHEHGGLSFALFTSAAAACCSDLRGAQIQHRPNAGRIKQEDARFASLISQKKQRKPIVIY